MLSFARSIRVGIYGLYGWEESRFSRLQPQPIHRRRSQWLDENGKAVVEKYDS